MEPGNFSRIIAACAILCSAGPAFVQEPPAQGEGEYRISTEVEHVVLPVTVVNRAGEFVQGLDRDRFKVYEDGREQQVTYFSHRDIPVTIGLVVDGSGSMQEKRAETVLAALHFVRLSNPEDEIFVVNFNERVSFGLPDATEFSNNPNQLRTALFKQPATGRTALYDAIAAGLEHLERGSRDKKALIVVSDGGDNASRASFRDTLTAAQKSNAIIYTIGLFDDRDPDRNPGVLKRLARVTGGEVYLPQKREELKAICEHIAHDLRSQYTIGYAPSNKSHDGTYRRVQVFVSRRDSERLVARTRAGYFAPSDLRSDGR